MTPDRRKQIETLFNAAREREPGERGLYLAGACPDVDLRREVESRLAREASGTSSANESTQAITAALGSLNQAPDGLTPGMQLGPYKIEARLGEGGMGEVFRALDTRLGRPVAIKTSKEHFSERFEREARAISSLSHPNICALYDVGPNYLIMELCEGETLAARIKRGPLPPRDVAAFGAQIADALSAAHAKGIVHRDLKPANVMLTKSRARVLDFGLSRSDADTTLTAVNMVLGTPAYMAPEQREGRPADHRTDIYSLGLLLTEMATGKRYVPGSEVELTSMPQLTPIVQRCLNADPDLRWQSAADLAWQLGALSQGGGNLRAGGKAEANRRLWPIWGACAALAAGLGIGWLIRPGATPATNAPRVEFTIAADNMAIDPFDSVPKLSPDGRYLAYLGKGANARIGIWVRAVAEPDAHPLANTDNASTLFWSPDSRWIGFFSDADHRVRKIAPAGGPAETMFSVPTQFQEPVWGVKGDILYRPLNREPLFRISESGGSPVQVTTLDIQRTENSHRGQTFLPDGRRFLFVARCADRAMNALYLGSLDTGRTTRIASLDSQFRFVAAPGAARGRIFYHRDDGLVSRTLNLTTGQLEGEPAVVIEHVAYDITGLRIAFNISADAHVAIWNDDPVNLSSLVWYSRQGEPQGNIGEPEDRRQIRLSPDGTRVVYAGVDPQTGNRDLFLMELARGISTRLTRNVANDWYPAWSPDGKSVLFVSDRSEGGTFSKPATNASADETRLYPTVSPEDWSRDGQWIAGFTPLGEKIWVAEAKPGATVVPILPPSLGRSDGIRFSPDSHWIAYVSNQSGRPEVYARKFLGSTLAPDGIQLSRDGADFPVWNPGGNELFFVGRDRILWSVDTRNLGNAPPPEPVRLFRLCEAGALEGEPSGLASYSYIYDTTNGKRFLVNCAVGPRNRFKISVNPPFAQ
ncbi:MAG: protein kinase [Acidobacteriota bacterium]|nr:protein kinase [Acidobacteriota bacterium]